LDGVTHDESTLPCRGAVCHQCGRSLDQFNIELGQIMGCFLCIAYVKLRLLELIGYQILHHLGHPWHIDPDKRFTLYQVEIMLQQRVPMGGDQVERLSQMPQALPCKVMVKEGILLILLLIRQ